MEFRSVLGTNQLDADDPLIHFGSQKNRLNGIPCPWAFFVVIKPLG
jgi:hypothetical protein